MGAAQTVSLPPPYAWPDLTHHATVSPLLVPGTKRCPDLTEAWISTQGHDFQGSGVGGGTGFLQPQLQAQRCSVACHGAVRFPFSQIR